MWQQKLLVQFFCLMRDRDPISGSEKIMETFSDKHRF